MNTTVVSPSILEVDYSILPSLPRKDCSIKSHVKHRKSINLDVSRIGYETPHPFTPHKLAWSDEQLNGFDYFKRMKWQKLLHADARVCEELEKNQSLIPFSLWNNVSFFLFFGTRFFQDPTEHFPKGREIVRSLNFSMHSARWEMSDYELDSTTFDGTRLAVFIK